MYGKNLHIIYHNEANFYHDKKMSVSFVTQTA